jgi:hypothetical protein
MGLEDDLRRLVQAFAEGGASRCREITGDLLARASGPVQSPNDRDGDTEIQLHGLGLEPADEDELGRLVRLVVEDRLRGEEAQR